MKVCVFGLWHLGSVYAACLSSAGHYVTGIDDNQKVITDLCHGKLPVSEVGLSELTSGELTSGRLKFSTEYSASVDADILWVTFDTPVDENDVADTSYVEERI